MDSRKAVLERTRNNDAASRGSMKHNGRAPVPPLLASFLAAVLLVGVVTGTQHGIIKSTTMSTYAFRSSSRNQESCAKQTAGGMPPLILLARCPVIASAGDECGTKSRDVYVQPGGSVAACCGGKDNPCGGCGHWAKGKTGGGRGVVEKVESGIVNRSGGGREREERWACWGVGGK